MAKRITNVGANTEYKNSTNYDRITNIGAEVEYEGATNNRRISAVGAMVEYAPVPSASVSPSISPSVSPSVSPSISPSISPSPSLSPSGSESPSASVSPSTEVSESPSISPSASISSSASRSPSASRSGSASISKSASASRSVSPSISRSVSPSLSPSASLSQSASASPSLPCDLFEDGFESGGIGAWSGSYGSPFVSVTAALSGNYGIRCTGFNCYVSDNTPNSETRYRFRFLFHPNSSNPGSNVINICTFTAGLVQFRYSGGYQIRVGAWNNSSGFNYDYSEWYSIGNAKISIEVDWMSGSPGHIKLWINKSLQEEVSTTNSNRRVNDVYLGVVSGTGSLSGNAYFDDFVSNRCGDEIGGLSPSASWSPSPSGSLSPSGSVSASPSPSLSPSGSFSPSGSRSPSRSVSPSISKSASINPSGSLSPSPSKSSSRSVSPSISGSASYSISPSASASMSATSIFVRSEDDAYYNGNYYTDDDTGIFTVYKPSDVQDEDYLVVIVGKQSSLSVIPPSGWTTGAEEVNSTGNDLFGGIYYKYISSAAGEPDTYDFQSLGLNEPVGWWIGSLAFVSRTHPEDVDFDTGSGDWIDLQDDTSPAVPNVVTATDDTFAFACWVVNNDPGVEGFPSSPWIVRAGTVGGNGVLTVFSKSIFGAGVSTGTPELTGLLGGQSIEVGTFVFRSIGISVSVSASPSLSPSASLSISPSFSESPSGSLSPSASESPSPSVSPTVSESESPSISVSLSLSLSPSASASHSISPSAAPRYKVRVQMMQ